MTWSKPLFRNTQAHIPFSVISVFLILGSSFTAVYVTKLEQDTSQGIASTLDITKAEQLLRYAEADIARMVNYAGMYALKHVGESPLLYSNLSSAAAKDYADGSESLENNPTHIDSEVEANIFNMNWARNITRVKLNEYLETNLMYNRCIREGFAINVKSFIGEWREITFTEIPMELTRAVSLDCMVTEPDNMQDDHLIYPTYWQAGVELTIVLTELSSGESWEFTIHPHALITSRLPLLMALTYTYQDTLGGVEGDFFGNKLQILVTLISQIYTEARSLVQWASGPTKVKNIVDNTWLKYVVNAGVTAEQFLVFNSVDPLALIDLIVHAKDLAGDSDPVGDTKDKQDLLQSGVSFLLDAGEDVLKTLEKDGIARDNASDMITNPQNYTDETTMMQASIGNLSEDLLYDVDYIYYYHNGTTVVTKDEDFYYTYGYDFTSGGKHYVLGNLDHQVFDRLPDYGTINQDVIDQVEVALQEAYVGAGQTDVARTIHSWYEEGWSPGVHHGVADKLLSSTDWTLRDCYNISENPLAADDVLPGGSYVERWVVLWDRTETWEICDHYNNTCRCCNESHIEHHTFLQEHTIHFDVSMLYPPADVADIFVEKEVFGDAPHPESQIDNNLAVLRSAYPAVFVCIRETVLESRSMEGLVDETSYQYGDGQNYAIEWLQGIDGCVLEALNNITSLIKADGELYGNISTQFQDYDRIEDMEKGRIALLENFTERRSAYLLQDHYLTEGSYNSAGAKTVYVMRQWFVDHIQEALSTSPTDDVTDEIAEHLGADGHAKLKDYDKMQAQYGDVLGSLGSIQFGLAMQLNRQDSEEGLGWSEEVALAVDQYPNYLLFHPKVNETGVEQPWYFNVKNICLFGPTGLPLLPIGVIPWVATINVWPIEIEGAYERFKLVDTLDETHVNPLFGHSGQIYQREASPVKDKICSGQLLGFTKGISFNFWTLNIGIVPPSKLPIGDQNIHEIIEYSDNE
ncbi:MAG: hypothetical protein JW771_03070 [Candidatus Thermoplasmatota archaeon]|nr:hypothetical protein [Candidatus Thermoplasmatota archaeon]